MYKLLTKDEWLERYGHIDNAEFRYELYLDLINQAIYTNDMNKRCEQMGFTLVPIDFYTGAECSEVKHEQLGLSGSGQSADRATVHCPKIRP